jgi:hypothetical protein
MAGSAEGRVLNLTITVLLVALAVALVLFPVVALPAVSRALTRRRLVRLNRSEKITLALKGSREERAILIRDQDELVRTAVLGNPTITREECLAFVGDPTIPDDVRAMLSRHFSTGSRES